MVMLLVRHPMVFVFLILFDLLECPVMLMSLILVIKFCNQNLSDKGIDIIKFVVIDSKIDHIRHFIKIPFINKGMDFIDLPSIFKDKSVQSSIPNYFKNCEVPIICYKYNIPIRGAIFNFDKHVSDLDTIETCTSDSGACKDSKYIYPAAGHVIMGNLKIISDSRIRSIIAKGPKYRYPVQIVQIDFQTCREKIAGSLNIKPPVISLLADPRRLFLCCSMVILDVARCYLWLFSLYINIKIGENSC